MRWFIEVSRVDEKTPAEKFCLEAQQWQAALQEARRRRGDSGPLSKFSIELIDDGYRAVDPGQKLRYVVAKAPDDAPLTNDAAATFTPEPVVNTEPMGAPPPSSKGSTATSSGPPTDPDSGPVPTTERMPSGPPPTGSKPPRPRLVVPEDEKPPAPPRKASTDDVDVDVSAFDEASAPTAAPAAAPTTSPSSPPAPSSPPRPESAAPPSTDTTAALAEPAPPAPASAPPTAAGRASSHPTKRSLEAAKPPDFQVIRKREEEPTEKNPIAYREYAYAVAEGTPPHAAELLLWLRFKEVKSSIDDRPQGKLVQLAVFDHVFESKPSRPPVATLAWKDWRGDPVVQFPASPGTTPTGAPPEAQSAVAAGKAPASVTTTEPAAAASAASAPSAGTAPAAAGGFPAPQAPPTEAKKSEPRPSSRPPSSSRTPGRRRAGEDLIGELFETMHDLHFAPDMVSGVEFVLSILQSTLPSEGMLVHVFDINTRHFVTIRAKGQRADDVILHRVPDQDPLFAAGMRRTRAQRVDDASSDERYAQGRWSQLGVKPAAALFGAVQLGGRYLGAIELANPQGGGPYTDSEAHALDYICEQFAEFLANRPLILDADVVLPKN